MKIVIAPDSFKESLSAERTAQAIKKGFEEIFPEAQYVCLPIADGGEGTVEAMIAATRGKLVTLTVSGPMSQSVEAFYGVTGDGRTAVIEMAAASGLMLVEPELRNPMSATSFGTGELIKHALNAGIRHIILGIGGSATVDGGIGMVQALGVHFYDADGNELAAGGGALSSLSHIDQQQIDPRVKECHFEIACDVDNPLTGPRVAAAVFGPQKGATPEMVIQLDNGLANLAEILGAQTGRDINAIVGGGAAGGMGVAAEIFLGGKLKPGIDIIMNAVNLEQVLEGADLVITGEGRIDSQTVGGKAPIGVARVAHRLGVPVIGMAGVLGEGVEVVHQHGIDAVFSILPRLAPLATVLLQGEINLQHCARNIAQAMKLGQAIPA